MNKADEDAPHIKTAAEYGCPERIWLQHDLEGTGEPYAEPIGDEVTWCWHKISQYDTEYVRADLHNEAIRAAYARGVGAERERAAKVCDEEATKGDPDDYGNGRDAGCEACAAAIRRGE